MEKGKFGISMAFYAVLGFILAVLGWETALFLLAGVVIFVEKNEWASRQLIQAICLVMVSSIIAEAFTLLGCFDWTSWVGGTYSLYTVWSRTRSIVYYGVEIVVFLFGLLAILKVAKGKEAGVPLADKFANWAYGKVVVVTVQPTVAPVAPVQQPVAPVQPAAPVDACANCGAPLNGAAFCTKCGTPAAK